MRDDRYARELQKMQHPRPPWAVLLDSLFGPDMQAPRRRRLEADLENMRGDMQYLIAWQNTRPCEPTPAAMCLAANNMAPGGAPCCRL